jgi:hypothetical protein
VQGYEYHKNVSSFSKLELFLIVRTHVWWSRIFKFSSSERQFFVLVFMLIIVSAFDKSFSVVGSTSVVMQKAILQNLFCQIFYIADLVRMYWFKLMDSSKFSFCFITFVWRRMPSQILGLGVFQAYLRRVQRNALTFTLLCTSMAIKWFLAYGFPGKRKNCSIHFLCNVYFLRFSL